MAATVLWQPLVSGAPTSKPRRAPIRVCLGADFDGFARRVASGEALRDTWCGANEGVEQLAFEARLAAERVERRFQISRRLDSAARAAASRAREIDSELGIARRWRSLSVDFFRNWPRYRKEMKGFAETPLGRGVIAGIVMGMCIGIVMHWSNGNDPARFLCLVNPVKGIGIDILLQGILWFVLSGWMFRTFVLATWVLPFAAPLLIGAFANNFVIEILLHSPVTSMATTLHCHWSSPASSLSTELRPSLSLRYPPATLSSLSWASSIPDIKLSTRAEVISMPSPLIHTRQVGIVHAAWTRRSRGEAAERPNRKSWKQRTDMYMRPFLLNVFFSKRFIHAKVVHRGTSKVISVASTNAKDLRNTLPSLTDEDACRTVGQLIAERSKEADVFAMSYEPRKNERIEGKLGIVIDAIKENGIIFV